jgi:WD40 repeat protein
VYCIEPVLCEKTYEVPGKSAVRSLLVLDGGLLAIGLYGGLIQLFDVDSWTPVRTLEGHTSHVMAMVRCGVDKLVSVSWDKTVRVWSMQTWQTERALVQTHCIRSAVMWGADKLVTGDIGFGLRVYDVGTWEVEQVLHVCSDSSVIALVVSPRHKLISASSDGTIKVWSSDYSLCHTLPSGVDRPNDMLLMGDALIVGGGGRSVATVWNTRTWTLSCSLPGAALGIDRLGIASLARCCGHRLAVGTMTGGVLLLDPVMWTVERILVPGYEDVFLEDVQSLTVTEMGQLVSGSGSGDGAVKLWGAGTGGAAAPLEE